ncbi:hypothetical protein NQ317_015440 [Molorchus minor]|uniref:Uncharacterized protein n=1 Tax=Molorchus minor TaxID=1323400 RepID=A0ABQ9J2V9_9CUCU|nr:hypothetical protein NQ317_015440 [Molorchus minor]
MNIKYPSPITLAVSPHSPAIKNPSTFGQFIALLRCKINTRLSEQINAFFNEAPDTKYLIIKVASIFGLVGASSREEFCKLTLDDIEESENSLLIHILGTKTNFRRSFCIVGSYTQTITIIMLHHTHRRFFLNYIDDKCTVQPVGINNPKQFSGRCFRRSSASLLENSRANLITIKWHVGEGRIISHG